MSGYARLHQVTSVYVRGMGRGAQQNKFVLETVRNDIGEVTMVNDDVKTTIVQVKSQGQDKEKKGRSWL